MIISKWVFLVLALVVILNVLPTAIDALGTLTSNANLGSFAGSAAVFGLVGIAIAGGVIMMVLKRTGVVGSGKGEN